MGQDQEMTQAGLEPEFMGSEPAYGTPACYACCATATYHRHLGLSYSRAVRPTATHQCSWQISEECPLQAT